MTTLRYSVMDPQPPEGAPTVIKCHQLEGGEGYGFYDDWDRVYLAPYRPGELVPVREDFALRVDVNCRTDQAKALHYIKYRADGEYANSDDMNWHTWSKWIPSRCMPDWAVRRHVRILSIRPVRASEVTEAEAERLAGCAIEFQLAMSAIGCNERTWLWVWEEEQVHA